MPRPWWEPLAPGTSSADPPVMVLVMAMEVFTLKLMGVLPLAAKARAASTATTACHF